MPKGKSFYIHIDTRVNSPYNEQRGGEVTMNSPKKRPTTYRLTHELDQVIASEAERLGISKNALVQMTLVKALGIKQAEPPASEAVNQ
jgi:ribosome-binding protein aMBF1 (putative translation factor)